MKRYGLAIAMLAVTVVALAGVVGKDGSTLPNKASSVTSPTRMPADFEWSSGGAMNTVPTLGGSATGWASHFIVMATNTLGTNIRLTELGFPCGGPATIWFVWLGTAQPPNYSTPDFTGAFTPVDTDPTTFPPTTYTYVDISASNIEIAAGASFWFGFQNPGMAGQIDYNSVDTYGWYGGVWDPDGPWGRTTVMQVAGNMVPVELQTFTVE